MACCCRDSSFRDLLAVEAVEKSLRSLSLLSLLRSVSPAEEKSGWSVVRLLVREAEVRACLDGSAQEKAPACKLEVERGIEVDGNRAAGSPADRHGRMISKRLNRLDVLPLLCKARVVDLAFFGEMRIRVWSVLSAAAIARSAEVGRLRMSVVVRDEEERDFEA